MRKDSSRPIAGTKPSIIQTGAVQTTLRPVANFPGSVISCADIASRSVLAEVNRNIARIAEYLQNDGTLYGLGKDKEQ